MTYAIKFSANATNDLDAILEWVENAADAAVADAYLARVYTRIATLADFPNRGAHRPDIPHAARALSFERRLLILYQVQDESVEILRVVSTSRDLDTLLSS